MSSNNECKEGDKRLLDVLFSVSPLLGVLTLLSANDQRRSFKVAAVLATIVGLGAAALV